MNKAGFLVRMDLSIWRKFIFVHLIKYGTHQYREIFYTFRRPIKIPACLSPSVLHLKTLISVRDVGRAKVELSCYDLCFPCSPHQLFHQVLQSRWLISFRNIRIHIVFVNNILILDRFTKIPMLITVRPISSWFYALVCELSVLSLSLSRLTTSPLVTPLTLRLTWIQHQSGRWLSRSYHWSRHAQIYRAFWEALFRNTS